jgi:nucleoid-associated protein YgaU
MSSIRLRKNNPYSRGAIFVFKDGTSFLRRTPVAYEGSYTDVSHLVRTDDTLSNIAFKHYGDSKYWWLIADVNEIHNPFELPIGTHILIPDFERAKTLYM